jgi:putative transposase
MQATVVGGRLQRDTARFNAPAKELDQAVIVISLMHKAESLLPAFSMFHQRHVQPFGNVDRDPRSGCEGTSLASHRQCPPRVLEQPRDVIADGGWLLFRMDYRSEFSGGQMDLSAYTHQVQMNFNRRGKPTDNATVESFNGKFREECLNAHWFESIDDAKEKIDAWRWDYNEHRPHRSLKGLTPREFAMKAGS